MSFLEQLAQAYLARERQRLGIPAEQRAEAANARANTALALQGSPEEAAAMRALRQREIEQELELKPKQVEAQLAAAGQHGRLTEAQIAEFQRKANAPIEVSPAATLAARTPEGGYKGVFTAPGRPATERPPHMVSGTDSKGNPIWGVPGSPGFSPPQTTVEKTRRDQAAHVISQGNALLRELEQPETQAVMGPRQGLVTQFKDTPIGGLITGGAPPEAGHLGASVASLAAFLPIMHGMRGGENMSRHFEGILGKNGELAIRRDPKVVAAATRAILEAAQRIREYGDNADLSDIPYDTNAPKAGGSKLSPEEESILSGLK